MTLAPTNEAIRHEIMRKNTLWVKKRGHYDLGVSWLGVRIVSIKISVRLMRVGDN